MLMSSKSNSTNKATKITLASGAALAIVAATVLSVNGGVISTPTAKATSSIAEVNVAVSGTVIEVTNINGTGITDQSTLNNTAIKTIDGKNKVTFKADKSGHAKIVAVDKVLWEGDIEAGVPVTAEFTLPNLTVGTHGLAIRVNLPGSDKYTQVFFNLDYRAVVPSIIPGGDVLAPNTGLYMTIGGHVYSATTIAILLILTAVAIYLISTRYTKRSELAKAKAKAKSSNKKMDMI